jgi:hypothetical protein
MCHLYTMNRNRNVRWLGSRLLRRHVMRHEAEIYGVLRHKVDIPAAMSRTANAYRVTF